MTRRTVVLVAATVLLLIGALVSSLPARASQARAIDPSQIDPTTLRLPESALPSPTEVCLFATVDTSGSITGGHVAAQSAGTAGATVCGEIIGYTPSAAATATAAAHAGFIIVGGKQFGIPVGVTVGGIDTVTHVDHSGVSDDADADGKTTPADGWKANLRIVHQQDYGPETGGTATNLGRLTGYRMDLQYSVQGTGIGTEYLASIFPSAAMAQAAMADSTISPALITIIGAPLPQPCTAGDQCKAFSGPNPGTTNNAVYAVFTRGPIMIETASQVPAAQFAQLEPAMQQTLYSLLGAADQVVQAALNGSPPPPPSTATSAPAATATSAPTATATATATETPLTVSVKVAHSTVAAGKKQTITVSTAPGADVKIVDTFPNGNKKTFTGTANSTGTATWTYTQPSRKTKGSNHTVHVTVTVTRGSEPSQTASKKYKIK